MHVCESEQCGRRGRGTARRVGLLEGLLVQGERTGVGAPSVLRVPQVQVRSRDTVRIPELAVELARVREALDRLGRASQRVQVAADVPEELRLPRPIGRASHPIEGTPVVLERPGGIPADPMEGADAPQGVGLRRHVAEPPEDARGPLHEVQSLRELATGGVHPT